MHWMAHPHNWPQALLFPPLCTDCHKWARHPWYSRARYKSYKYRCYLCYIRYSNTVTTNRSTETLLCFPYGSRRPSPSDRPSHHDKISCTPRTRMAIQGTLTSYVSPTLRIRHAWNANGITGKTPDEKKRAREERKRSHCTWIR